MYSSMRSAISRLATARGITTAVGAGLAIAFAYNKMRALRRQRRRRRVVITGGCGNLGSKLAKHLVETTDVDVILLEHPSFFVAERVPNGAVVVLGDLANGHHDGGGWRHALNGADCLVHFSAVNPYPNATWEESAASMDHSFNVFLAAVQSGVRRVVFASSNHVVGGHKDDPTGGKVTPSSPPLCGTFLRNSDDAAGSGDAVAYAAAKVAGERLCRALAACPSNRGTSFVALRVGWCQPGANHPSTLSSAGVPPDYRSEDAVEAASSSSRAGKEDQSEDVDGDVDEAWFRNMWLSNGDFLRFFDAAIKLPLPAGEMRLVNAMSRKTGMRWCLADTEATLGVVAQDDSSSTA